MSGIVVVPCAVLAVVLWFVCGIAGNYLFNIVIVAWGLVKDDPEDVWLIVLGPVFLACAICFVLKGIKSRGTVMGKRGSR